MPINLWPSYFNICIGIFVLLITLGIAFYVWLHRHLPTAKNLIVLCLAGSLWSVAYLLELINRTLTGKLFWENIQYFALSVVLIYYLVFTITYARKQTRLSFVFWLLLLIEPVVNQLVLWMDPMLHWFRKTAVIQTRGLDYPGFLNSTYGPWFWINVIYTLFFFAIIFISLLINYFTSPKWSRGRLWYLIIAIVIPMIATILSIPSWILDYQDYLVILSVAISLFIIAWGIFHTRLLDIVPIARETLLDQMNDAVIMLDATGHVVDLNQAARKQFQASSTWIGKSFSTIHSEFSDITLDKTANATKEKQITLSTGTESQNFELKISPLQSDNLSHAGWLIIFHDITSHFLEEEKLRAAQAEAQSAYRKSQRHQQELDVIRKITETLNQSKSLRQALLPAMESISQITHNAMVWVYLLNGEEDRRNLIVYRPEEATSPLHFYLEDPKIPACLQKAINDESIEAGILSCDCGKDFCAQDLTKHFTLPLRAGNSNLGVLNIAISSLEQMDEGAIVLIKTLCNSLSIAIERVAMFKAEHSQKRLAIAQQQISSKLTSVLDLDEVLDLFLGQISRLVPFDCGNVMLLNDTYAWIARSRGYEYMGADYNKEMASWKFPISTTMNVESIVKSKKPMIIEDTQLEPGWLKVGPSTQMHGWLGAPILINNRVVAIFSLEKKEKGFYTQDQAEWLNSFCSSAALAYQNATLFAEVKKRIREFESLQITMQDITSELDLKLLLHEITARSIELLGSTSGILGLINNEIKVLDVVVGINRNSEFAGEVIPIGKGAMGKVAQTRKPLVINDYSTWAGRYDRLVSIFPHAVIQVPLLAGDEFLGVLGVGDDNPNRKYTEEEVRLLSLFAQQATIGIRNARLYTDAKHQADEANTLREASAIVASTLDQKQALRLILNQLAKVIPFDSASVLLEKEGELEVVEGKGFKDSSPLLGLRILLNSAQPGAVVYQSKSPLIVHNMPVEYPEFNEIARLKVQSWIGVPLIYGSRVIGILALDSMEPNRYNEDHARLATAFAGHVAIALENVRHYQSALQSTKRLTALYKLSQHISSNLQPDEVYHAIHKATKDLMACDSFILSLFDEKTQMINDVYFIDHGIPQKLTSRPLGVGLATKVINEKKTIFYNHFNIKMIKRTNAVLVGEDKDESVVRSFIIVPLKLGKNIKGILSTQSYTAGAFTEEDKETLELLASHAVIALENANLFSEVQELAITDSLTKIYNRRRFFELAEAEFERSLRYERPLSIIMMDIDHFKRINDTYGHAAGDLVLETLAQLILKSMREVDVFARYGGEEFVILLPETTAIEAQLTAERVRQLVARSNISIKADITVNVTISFGVVELDDTCRNTEELLDRSDQALYHSKRGGRNRVSVWSAGTQPQPPSEP